ncbi:unnamed protein product, partial [marine sediment metagenome]
MMRSTLLIAFALLLILSACKSRPPVSGGPYEIAFLWEYAADDYVRSSPAVGGGTVYVGSDDNALHAIDAETGGQVWRYDTKDNITSGPLVVGETVCFGSWDGNVYALALDTGELRWRYPTGGWVSGS